MLKAFAPFPVLALVCVAAQAQNTTGATPIGSLQVESANQRIKEIFKQQAPQPLTQPLDLYKLRYQSRNEKGLPVILSGLLVLPRGKTAKGLVVYNHGTMVNRWASPSRFRGQQTGSESEIAVLAFASGGYAVALPDYLGLGDHEAQHPYPLANVNSASCVDMIRPARAAATRLGVQVAPPLFITGYSQGGAVAMAATRAIEAKNDPQLRVTASAPLSGPYDLAGVTRRSLLVPPKNQIELATRLYLMSYMVYYFHKTAQVKLEDYFHPTMANAVAKAYGNKMSDEQIVQRLAFTALFMGARSSLEKVLNPRFFKAMKDMDTKDPLIRELVKNDCYNWAPRSRMLLVALQNDSIVPTQNMDIAIKTMRSKGVTTNTLRQHLIKDKSLNHISAIPATLMVARRFFDEGFAGVVGES
jgi:pimeloyl-ACP methyl ester carboxylesterase